MGYYDKWYGVWDDEKEDERDTHKTNRQYGRNEVDYDSRQQGKNYNNNNKGPEKQA